MVERHEWGRDEITGAIMIGAAGAGIISWLVWNQFSAEQQKQSVGPIVVPQAAVQSFQQSLDQWPGFFVQGIVMNLPLYAGLLIGTAALNVKAKHLKDGKWDISVPILGKKANVVI